MSTTYQNLMFLGLIGAKRQAAAVNGSADAFTGPI